MRKLLLATVAALGASMGVASYADAQIVMDDNDGQSFPTPGQITVRLNGRFRFYAAAVDQGAARTTNFGYAAPFGSGTGTTATTTTNAAVASAGTTTGTIAAATSNAGINKLASYGFMDYARLYPGFDGVAANGLKYGASLEVREDNNYGAGGGSAGSITGQNRDRDVLYLRRQWGYLGSDRFGTLRLGSSDNPESLYLTGTFETFDAGGLNGDVEDFLPGNLILNYPFADVGNMYSTTKAVYLSPQFYGFDSGLSFEPSTANGGENNASGCGPTPAPGNFTAAGQSVATLGCDQLSSTSTGDYARRKDTYEALLRYRGTFGAFGVAATASYTGSGVVNDSGIVGSTTNPKRYKLEDLSVGHFGLAVTYGGLSFGGNYQLGRYNPQGGGGYGGLIAKGQPNASAFIVGATYTIGPVIFGAHYLRSQNEGDQATATNRNINGVPYTGAYTGGQRMEQGVGAGGTYSLAPGVSLYLSYIWMERKQNGYNFISGASNNPYNNKVDGNVFALGTSFAW